MITRIEIDGFKSFHKFAADLRPFQVFIGPNGVGKTNLFDAILLLANLAGDRTVDEALKLSRGELSELFTLYPDGTRARVMSFAVEMLIDKAQPDAEGKARPPSATRLRYELDLESRIEDGRDRVYVVKEGLLPIKESADTWVKENIPARLRKDWVVREKRPPFIATVGDDSGQMTIFRNQDAPAGGKEGTVVGTIDRTILSATNAARYPTIDAARQEMRNWRFLQLNPYMLRLPAATSSPTALLADGSNLAAVLDRIARAHGGQMEQIRKDLSTFIPTVRALKINPVPGQDTLLIEIEAQDSSRFSSRVLSDGTLRLLALIALKHDRHHKGVLCFEEPENGVQPLRLRHTVDVLYALATDLNKPGEGEPLRQVLVNTHSPGLLANAPTNSVYYVHIKAEAKGRATQIIPVRAELIQDEAGRYYTWEQVISELESSKGSLEIM